MKTKLQATIDQDLDRKLRELWKQDRAKTGFDISFSEWLGKHLKDLVAGLER
jgi:hypothetical protein